jgi:alkanesulfonate monooxygenase SsuD/methylene tetrahydromethanopterin reductase-like flavin-dependent oxidoreductase (luciferase family)
MGLPFPSAGERIGRLEEALQIALQLWSGEDKPFDGAYYRLTSTAGSPLWVQRPHPPILIGGGGPRMLRLMAKYADVASIGLGQDPAELRAKLEVLRQQCAALNRPYEEIEKMTLYMAPVAQNGHLDPAALDTFRALAELGFDEVMISLPGDPADFDLLAAELVPAVDRIPVNRE